MSRNDDQLFLAEHLSRKWEQCASTPPPCIAVFLAWMRVFEPWMIDDAIEGASSLARVMFEDAGIMEDVNAAGVTAIMCNTLKKSERERRREAKKRELRRRAKANFHPLVEVEK